MKIEQKSEREYFLIPEENETAQGIAVALILSSYELASPIGAGFARPHETDLTREMALQMIAGKDVSGDYPVNRNKENEVIMDYVFGRCCKTYITVLEDRVRAIISTVDRDPEAIIERVYDKLKDEQS